MTWELLRQKLQELAGERGDWAGIPMPVQGTRMVMEKRYPYQKLCEVFDPEQGYSDAVQLELSMRERTGDEDATVWSMFYSHKLKRMVYIFKRTDGKMRHWPEPVRDTTLEQRLNTLNVAASEVWGVEAEVTAQAKLAKLIGEHLFKLYLLSGYFIKTSKRSGVSYMFRRLQPTVAFRAGKGDRIRGSTVLAELCLHPIGYYDGSNAGAMVPTDEVIAHYLLAMNDEHRFWRLSNQHKP